MQPTLLTAPVITPTLRPYQDKAIAAIESVRDRQKDAALIVLATGGGKTIVFSELIRRWDIPTLILAHREELLTQARDKLLSVWPQADIGIIGAGYDERHHQITIASVASMVRGGRLELFAPPRLGLVVVDEAHHTPASTYRKVLSGVGCGIPGGPFLLGVTATPQRADGKLLSPIYGDAVFTAGLIDLVRAGYLCDLRAIQVRTSCSLDGVKVGKDGDFQEEYLAAAINHPERNRIIVDAFQQHAPDRPTIVFAANVEHAHDLASVFRARGITAAAIDGTTHRDTRQQTLRDFAAGRIQVVCNCMVLTEGFDQPETSCLILARPTQSRSLYIQMAGRGARPAPGKHDCLIIDIADNTREHSLNLMSLPKLAGRLGYENTGSGQRTAQEKDSNAMSLREMMDNDLPSSVVERRVDLMTDAFTWEKLGGGNYGMTVASAQSNAKISFRLELLDDGYIARVVWTDGTNQKLTPTCSPLDWAQAVAEDAALHIVKGEIHLVDRRAPWREFPATDKQKKMLKVYGITAHKGMTRGQASDAISAAVARQGKGNGK